MMKSMFLTFLVAAAFNCCGQSKFYLTEKTDNIIVSAGAGAKDSFFVFIADTRVGETLMTATFMVEWKGDSYTLSQYGSASEDAGLVALLLNAKVRSIKIKEGRPTRSPYDGNKWVSTSVIWLK